MKRVWEGVRRYGKTLHSVGLSFGLVFFVLSMSPSLLPRALVPAGRGNRYFRRHRVRHRCDRGVDDPQMRSRTEMVGPGPSGSVGPYSPYWQ